MDSEPTARRPTLPLEDERRIIKLARRGDRDAWLELVTWHQRALYRLAYALTRTPDDAAQITREALLRGWQSLQQLPEGQRVLPWLIRIVRGLAIALARRRAGTPEAQRILDEVVAASAHVNVETVGLLEAFIALETDDQIAIACRLLEDMPYGDIEAAIQTPPGSAMRRLSLARVALEGGSPQRGESVA